MLSNKQTTEDLAASLCSKSQLTRIQQLQHQTSLSLDFPHTAKVSLVILNLTSPAVIHFRTVVLHLC